ncbi:MAG TPA: zf-HC2 domain-containing protein [Kofleriaceae bacterium]|nr:zf-HC2 domain-containing protein [Kofleriaceae bacterium]
MALSCPDIEPLVPTFLDGELCVSDADEVASHAATCTDCRDHIDTERRVMTALRSQLAGPIAPADVHQRVGMLLDNEDLRTSRARRRAAVAWALPATSVAAAAAALMVTFVATHQGPPEAAAITREAASQMLDRAPLVVQPTAEMTRSVGAYLRAPVDAPQFVRAGIQFRGWRPINLRDRQAAELVYDVRTQSGGYSLLVHIMRAGDLSLRSQDRRVVDGKAVWIFHPYGMTSVAYKSEKGIGYVFTSAMPEGELVGMIAGSDILRAIGAPLPAN